MNLWGRVVSGTLLLAAATGASGASAAEDLLVRRDGSRSNGQLRACVGETCNWNGTPVPRVEIAWIGLGAAGTPPTPRDPQMDAIWPRDGHEISGPIVGLSLGEVATETDSLDRADVSWIYFGSAEGLPRQQTATPVDVPSALPAMTGTAPSPGADSSIEEAHAPVEATKAVSALAAPPALPSRLATLYLNEVSVLPHEGRSPFVELGNAGTSPIPLAGVALRNERGTVCSLPKDASVPASGLYLISLDGSVGGGFAHCPRGFLTEKGSVVLKSAGGSSDLLDWGESPSGLALRTRGGRISDLVPGTSFGRVPAPLGGGGLPWVRYSQAQVTPGEINPLPAVDSFMALSGAIFERRKVPLTWYTVGGAEHYRVQVSTASDFSASVLDRTFDTSAGRANAVGQVITDPLSAGRYFWRVQALGAGAEAPFSEPRSFEVREVHTASASPAPDDQGNFGAPETPAPAAEEDGAILNVPYIEQNKDTWLLALEADAEDPDPKPWDRPWRTQPPYCARASIAMVNAYYHAKLNLPGTLSQDRITYEVYRDRTLHEGPEVDIYVDAGFNAPMIAKALEYALGAPASVRFLVPVSAWEEYVRNIDTTGKFIWETVENELKEGRPIVGTSACHAWVFAGYRRVEGWLELRVLDPAMGSYWFRPGVLRELTGEADQPAGTALTETFFLPKLGNARPASDEPSIEPDSDQDGVRDFDEAVRFKTDPRDDDSDDDGVRDKEEIRASVFEPVVGWSIRTRNLHAGEYFPRPSTTGRDLDGDGKAMELDPDSDNGGCKDGEEDLNGNGIRDPGETSNFDKSDDPATEDGCGLWTGTVETHYWERNVDDARDWHIVAKVRLREVHFVALLDPGPEHGGHTAGARIGSQVHLECAGTTIHETSRMDMWSLTSDYRGVCTTEGTKAIDAGNTTDGLLFRKSADIDLTPILGFDVPRGGGLYLFGCSPGFTHDLAQTCTSSSSYGGVETHSDFLDFTGQAGIGDLGTTPYRGCHDPEVRFLAADGKQMTGTYSYDESPGDCVPRHAEVSWSLCKVGTPCAPLPPLPGASAPPP